MVCGLTRLKPLGGDGGDQQGSLDKAAMQ